MGNTGEETGPVGLTPEDYIAWNRLLTCAQLGFTVHVERDHKTWSVSIRKPNGDSANGTNERLAVAIEKALEDVRRHFHRN